MDLITLVFNMTWLKDLARRTASDEVLRDKSFNIGYQRELASMVYTFFDKKSPGNGINMHENNEHPLDLAEELHKPIIRTFKKRTLYSRFKDSIRGVDLADIQLISRFNKRFSFYLLFIFLVNMLGLFL